MPEISGHWSAKRIFGRVYSTPRSLHRRARYLLLMLFTDTLRWHELFWSLDLEIFSKCKKCPLLISIFIHGLNRWHFGPIVPRFFDADRHDRPAYLQQGPLSPKPYEFAPQFPLPSSLLPSTPQFWGRLRATLCCLQSVQFDRGLWPYSSQHK